MIEALAVGGMTAALVLAAWTGAQAGRRRPTTEAQMIGAIVVEAALVVQAVIATVRVATGTTVAEPATFLAYLFGVLLPLPLGFHLAREERTRWGSLILCATAVVVGVMTLRLLQLWSAGRG